MTGFGSYGPDNVQNLGPGSVLTFWSDLTSAIKKGSPFFCDTCFTSTGNAGPSAFIITAIAEPATCVVEGWS